jgi:hypothetical protein
VNSCPRLTPLLLPWLLGAGELGLGHQNAANASGASSAIASAPPAASARLAAALPAAASPTILSRAPSRPRWFGWPATCVPGPSRRPTRSSPPPAASASCRNRVGHIGNHLLPARLGSQHGPAGVRRWRSGSQVLYQGELLLIRQKAPSWQQVGSVRANARVQAGTSEAADALT